MTEFIVNPAVVKPITGLNLRTVDGYKEARRRIDTIRLRRWSRAMAVVREAGCFDALQLHNAMVSYRAGRPWEGVDYAKGRKAMRMLSEQFVGQRYLDRLWMRVCREEYGYKGPVESDERREAA